LEELQNSGEEAIIDLLESRIMNAEDNYCPVARRRASNKPGEIGENL
jgi:hypothetical protein